MTAALAVVMAQKQEIMPGIFMTAQQQGDSFAPYFEYKLENTRASGKRVEVSIDFSG